MVSAGVDTCFKHHFIVSIIKMSFNFIINIQFRFFYEYIFVIFVKLMKIDSQSLTNVFCSLENVNSKIKHCTSMIHIIGSVVTWGMGVFRVVEFNMHAFDLIFEFFNLFLQNICSFMKSSMHSNKNSIRLNSILF